MPKFFSLVHIYLADRLGGDTGAPAVEGGLIIFLIGGAVVAVVAILGTTVAAGSTPPELASELQLAA
jgi:Flp pilus assembly pilin Flp